MIQFRVPPAELNRSFRRLVISAGIGLVVLHFLLPFGISGTTAGTLAAIGVVGYFYTRQHVWFTLSPDGISGSGYTNRKIHISWSDAISINPTRMSDMDGVEIRISENAGLVKKQVLSLFIPRPISDTRGFSDAVGLLAPKDHPLRKLSGTGP